MNNQIYLPEHRGRKFLTYNISIEDFWIEEVGDYLGVNRLLLHCDWCDNDFMPFFSRLTYVTDNGWRWVGLDYREPYTTYKTKHAPQKCGAELVFTLYTPQ